MRVALESIIQRKFGTGGPYNQETDRPRKVSARIRTGAKQSPPEVLNCIEWIAQYIYSQFGKFPWTLPTMFVRTFLQIHHLDLEFYDKFFQAGAYLQTYRLVVYLVGVTADWLTSSIQSCWLSSLRWWFCWYPDA